MKTVSYKQYEKEYTKFFKKHNEKGKTKDHKHSEENDRVYDTSNA